MISGHVSAALFWLPAILTTTGCAQMTVRVEILNSAYWATPQYIDELTVTQIGASVQRIRDGRFAADRDTMKRSLAEAIQRMAVDPKACGLDKPSVAVQQVGRLTQNVAITIDREFGKANAQFEAAFDKVREAVAATTQEGRAKLIRDAGTLFGTGAAVIADLVKTLSAELRTTYCKIPPDATTPDSDYVKKVEGQVQSAAEGLIGKAGLLDDPRASAAVYAPDHYWERRFNDTVCAGSFGNTDCAVKMEGLGSFTLKGVRLDATKITQATFSVAREAIQTVAAIYGVPVPKGAPAANGQASNTQAASTSEIPSPVKRQWDASGSRLQCRLARLAILDSILGQRQAIAGVDQIPRDQAVIAIKAVFQANRPQLDPPAAQ
jgi:hypothetical protein